VAVKPGQELISLGPHVSAQVMTHPAQRAIYDHITKLIEQLRALEQAGDFYDFQRRLFGLLYQVEERRGQCSRLTKRLQRGRGIPRDAPPPPHSGDPSKKESWELEAYVYERLARQLRTVGDGFAWRCFSYNRQVIQTLSRNDAAGPMYGKIGLPYELGAIQHLWDENGHFALHHDLTNCLRIADLTEFTGDGGALLHEIKRTPHTEQAQVDRTQAAINALMHGGDLPGGPPGARLAQLDEPYVTNLKELGELLDRAKEYGCQGMALSQGRALVASSLPDCIRIWGTDHQAQGQAVAIIRAEAIEQAGTTGAPHHIRGISADTAARQPILAPWSIYPFPPRDCAALICDLLIFDTITSDQALMASFERAGLRGEILLTPTTGQLAGATGVVRAHLGTRALTWHAYGLGVLLFELAEPDTLTRGSAELLRMADPPIEPTITYSGEAETWLPELRGG
jgi:hypothetical protein